MTDLDTLGVLGTQKTVFFQEPPEALQNQIAEASKTVERLQEQLNEANNIIVKADWDCDYTLQSKCGFSDYLKKYNVRGVK